MDDDDFRAVEPTQRTGSPGILAQLRIFQNAAPYRIYDAVYAVVPRYGRHISQAQTVVGDHRVSYRIWLWG